MGLVPMNVESVSPRVQQFLRRHIDSVAKLDCLLLLRRESSRNWTARDAASELRSAEGWLEDLLRSLAQQGLLEDLKTTPASYRFAPQNDAQAEDVRALAESYAMAPTAIIDLIYASRSSIQNFADAFRIRKDDSRD